MGFKIFVLSHPQKQPRPGNAPLHRRRHRPEAGNTGAHPAHFACLQIHFKGNKPHKSFLIEILSQTAIEPANLFRQRQVEFVDFPQQHMDGRGMQGGRESMAGGIHEKTAQYLSPVTPVQKIQVAAHIAIGVEYGLDFQELHGFGDTQHFVLHPRRHLCVPLNFLLAPDRIRYVLNIDGAEIPAPIANQDAGPFHMQQNSVAVAKQAALRRQHTGPPDCVQNRLQVFLRIHGHIINGQIRFPFRIITELGNKLGVSFHHISRVRVKKQDSFRRLLDDHEILPLAFGQRLIHLSPFGDFPLQFFILDSQLGFGALQIVIQGPQFFMAGIQFLLRRLPVLLHDVHRMGDLTDLIVPRHQFRGQSRRKIAAAD